MIHKINFKDLSKKSKTPVFTYCRKLIKDGFDENDSLECYRGEQMDLRIKNIGFGAKLTVLGDDETLGARPHFGWVREAPRSSARIT